MGSQTVTIDGNSISYTEFGPKNGSPLVLLQRFRGTTDHWDSKFLNLLSRDRRVVAFDSLGVGRSEGITPNSISGMAAFAAQFLKSIGVENADLLGWSMGGCVAQRVAIDFPILVNRLILAATSPGGLENAPKMSEKVLSTMTKQKNNDEDFLYLFFPPSEEGRSVGRAHLNRLVGHFSSEVSAASFMAQLAAIRSWSMGADSALKHLKDIGIPVFVANGQFDVMIPAYNSFALAQGLPNALLKLYPRSGHAFLFQHCEMFCRDVLEFLREDSW